MHDKMRLIKNENRRIKRKLAELLTTKKSMHNSEDYDAPASGNETFITALSPAAQSRARKR